MNFTAFLFDVAPSSGTIGAVVAVAFFLMFLAVAVVAFKALKKTAKMAFRLVIVGIILVIAIAGSLALWYFSGVGEPKLKPPRKRASISQPAVKMANV